MISAFGIEHGDEVAKGIPSALRGKEAISGYGKARQAMYVAGRTGRPDLGFVERMRGVKLNTTFNASRGKLAAASTTRGSKAGATLRTGKYSLARDRRRDLQAAIRAKNTRVLP